MGVVDGGWLRRTMPVSCRLELFRLVQDDDLVFDEERGEFDSIVFRTFALCVDEMR